MCTVSYIPQGKGQFILSSNRDEQALRSPQEISSLNIGQKQVLFPRDAGAGGTWIASSDQEQVVCLLNGAFVKHQHQPPYKRSRGLMVLDFFEWSSAAAFFERYDFEGMEAFTFIVVERGQVFEFRWDEQNKHLKNLVPHQAYLWSSAPLYPPQIQQKRQTWFQDWLSGRNDFSLASILKFHQTGGDGDPENDFVMNRRDIVQTVSITNVVCQNTQIEMHYHDLIRQSYRQAQLSLA